MQRRKYLKAFGTGAITTGALTGTAAAATREWVDSYYYGDSDTSNYNTPNVEIYRAANADGIYRYYARQATENVLKQLTDAGDIAGYKVTTWNTDWQLSDCTDIWTEWHNFRENNTSWDDNGVHLLVNRCDSDALGKGAPVPCWDQDGSAYARTSHDDRPEKPFKHTVAMEVLHSFIDSGSCCDVQDETGPDNSEHSLGTVIDVGGDKLATPMATKPKWDVGECPYSGSSKDGITMQLSDCTHDSMRYSAAHVAGYHSRDCS